MTTNSKIFIDTSGQSDLFAYHAAQARSEKPILTEATPGIKRRFNAPDPTNITIGNTLLEEHLTLAKQKLPLVIAQVLDNQSWIVFEQRYSNQGRPPYAPRNMLGLILYGFMQGVSSLRGLERLARLDLGCMWVTGGIAPDHANIGRFINMHSESLTESFFESIVQTTLIMTGSGIASLAGDGTVIEAACSHYKVCREEALKAAEEEAQKALDKDPKNSHLQDGVDQITKAVKIFDERKKNREANGRKSHTLSISPSEPEAMVQQAKRGRGYAASYKPSVLANEQRVVVAIAVDPSNENIVIPKMLDRAMSLTSQKTEQLLLDAGYCTDNIINDTLDRDISLLCPEGKKPGKPKDSKKFAKGRFRYDATQDVYICPAGEQLIFITSTKDSEKTKGQSRYGNAPCQDCSLKIKCTTNKKGREIKRYAMDEHKDALREIMKHPKAKENYGKRQGMVEPVFSYLRQVQGLNRFRRKGLNGVRTEFTLHMMAYNLSRILAYICDKTGFIGSYIRQKIAIIAIAMIYRIFQIKGNKVKLAR
jgi:transposase